MKTYINKKNGQRYIVLYEAIDCTNSRDGLPVVVYTPQARPDFVCVREKSEFMEKFLPLEA